MKKGTGPFLCFYSHKKGPVPIFIAWNSWIFFLWVGRQAEAPLIRVAQERFHVWRHGDLESVE